MNMFKNDRGDWVVATGAPGSVERIKCEYPLIIAMAADFWDGSDEEWEDFVPATFSRMEKENFRIAVLEAQGCL